MKKDKQNDFDDDIFIRIQKLKQALQEITQGKVFSDISPNCSPEIEEQFLSNVLSYEQADQVPLFDVLIKAGLPLPSPKELNEPQLLSTLWDVIQSLSLLKVYILNTNHLSDRELYVELWDDLLREPTVLMPSNPNYFYHIDLVGSGSEADIFLYLKYYAGEEERQQWKAEWPEDKIPEHEAPPYDRDRYLPQPDYSGELPII